LFLGGALAIKNSQSEEGLYLLNSLSTKHSGLPIYYAEYLKGEIYLHKAEYLGPSLPIVGLSITTRGRTT